MVLTDTLLYGNVLTMDTLRTYLNSLSVPQQADFAKRCETTVGYLRKAISQGQRIGEKTTILIERESGGVVTCEELRPDVDWAYLRGNPLSEQQKALACSRQGDRRVSGRRHLSRRKREAAAAPKPDAQLALSLGHDDGEAA